MTTPTTSTPAFAPNTPVVVVATGAAGVVEHVTASDPEGTGPTYRYLVAVGHAHAWMTADEITPTPTCTVVTGPQGERCGQPAVQSWVSSYNGEALGECSDHAVALPSPQVPAPGDRVTVNHVGRTKVGTVIAERSNGRRFVVEVPLASGQVKLVTYAAAEITPA